jgi:hypothetical protein
MNRFTPGLLSIWLYCFAAHAFLQGYIHVPGQTSTHARGRDSPDRGFPMIDGRMAFCFSPRPFSFRRVDLPADSIYNRRLHRKAGGFSYPFKISEGNPLQKRPRTPGYIFFYLVFLPDTWQILIAMIAAVLVAPQIITSEMGNGGSAIVHLMIAGIVYAITRPVGKRISELLQKLILNKHRPD